jgi:hypothetical protein
MSFTMDETGFEETRIELSFNFQLRGIQTAGMAIAILKPRIGPT